MSLDRVSGSRTATMVRSVQRGTLHRIDDERPRCWQPSFARPETDGYTTGDPAGSGTVVPKGAQPDVRTTIHFTTALRNDGRALRRWYVSLDWVSYIHPLAKPRSLHGIPPPGLSLFLLFAMDCATSPRCTSPRSRPMWLFAVCRPIPCFSCAPVPARHGLCGVGALLADRSASAGISPAYVTSIVWLWPP